MQNLVYFPSFEPLSPTWLKFALLYVENFNPIIPHSGDMHLTREYRRVMNETDLIEPYRPTHDQGDRASLKAISMLETIQVNPHRFANVFGPPNIIRVMANRDRQRFKIFGEKFSYHWERYCLENGLGERTEGGMLVSQELGFLFMTFLAEEIAHEEGKSIITDDTSFDNFLNYKRTLNRSVLDRHRFAQGVISLTVPKNISEIPIDTLVNFRNRNRERIRAFNHELDSALNNVEARVDAEHFVTRFNNIYSELTTEVLAQGLGIATIPLGIYLLMRDTTATDVERIRDLVGGMGMLLTGTMAVRGRWREISSRHNCRRYLTNLSRLQ